jgi:hypothetical protein
LWASGFDYSSVEGTERLINEVDRTVGLQRLRCFHFNDSKIELGGNRDRHANIGEGTIGERGLAPLVGHPSIRDLPLLLEVPGDGDGPRAIDVAIGKRVVDAGIALYDGDPHWDSIFIAKILEPSLSSPKKAAPAKKSAAKKASKKATPVKKSVSAKKKVAKKAVPARKSAPIKKVTKKTAPAKKAKKTSPAKKAAPKKAAPAKKSAAKKPAKKAAPAKTVAAKKKATKKAAPAKRSVKKAAKKSTKKTTKKK